uniref:MULE transposase domain-containing protein n=1 Tax=Lactuca sativa TaxID=4236 RepID=A0A9R1W8I8_LACSA|nr:hypothetical protein LSAT_V11C300148450 [Lactuca sativa]
METHEESFQRLRLYCYKLEKMNLGTVQAFQTSLHSIIIIDVAYLKGKYLGTIFIYVGMDDNNQTIPIAFGVGKTESVESWSWFYQDSTNVSGTCRKCSRSCFHVVWYNIMTSYSVESINALSRDARKLPITMLIDFFRATMQRWWCQRRKGRAKSKKDITEYAEKVIDTRINKSSAYRVYQIDQSRYEVANQMKNGIVNFESRCFTCGKRKSSNIPCSHAMSEFNELRYQHCNTWVSSYFTIETYRSTYREVVFPMLLPAEYEQLEEMMVVLPPLMDKRQVR